MKTNKKSSLVIALAFAGAMLFAVPMQGMNNLFQKLKTVVWDKPETDLEKELRILAGEYFNKQKTAEQLKQEQEDAELEKKQKEIEQKKRLAEERAKNIIETIHQILLTSLVEDNDAQQKIGLILTENMDIIFEILDYQNQFLGRKLIPNILESCNDGTCNKRLEELQIHVYDLYNIYYNPRIKVNNIKYEWTKKTNGKKYDKETKTSSFVDDIFYVTNLSSIFDILEKLDTAALGCALNYNNCELLRWAQNLLKQNLKREQEALNFDTFTLSDKYKYHAILYQTIQKHYAEQKIVLQEEIKQSEENNSQALIPYSKMTKEDRVKNILREIHQILLQNLVEDNNAKRKIEVILLTNPDDIIFEIFHYKNQFLTNKLIPAMEDSDNANALSRTRLEIIKAMITSNFYDVYYQPNVKAECIKSEWTKITRGSKYDKKTKTNNCINDIFYDKNLTVIMDFLTALHNNDATLFQRILSHNKNDLLNWAQNLLEETRKKEIFDITNFEVSDAYKHHVKLYQEIKKNYNTKIYRDYLAKKFALNEKMCNQLKLLREDSVFCDTRFIITNDPLDSLNLNNK